MDFPDLFCYVNKLKMSQTNIEKGTGDSMRHIDSLCAINLQEESHNLNILREKELYDLKKNVVDTMRSVYFIKSQMTDKNLLNINIEKMKKHMLTLENCTNVLKYKIIEGLDDLSKEERDLTIDVTNTEMNLNEFSKTDKEPIKYSNYAAKYVKDHELLQEVKDFLLFLYTNGGHQGGWSSKDHKIFVNIFNRLKNRKSVIETLLKMFPDMTEDKVIAHINWYEKYIDLRNIQKIAIEKWREERNKKPKTPTKLELLFPKSESSCNSTQNSECNKKIIKEKIKKWHVNKQEKVEEELMLKKKKSNCIKQKEKEKTVNNQEKKEQVRMWKLAKLAKKEAETVANQILEGRQQERKILAKKLIKEYQNQDKEYIKKRMYRRKIIMEEQNQELNMKKLRLRHFDNKFKYGLRNLSELRKPTEAWLNKQRTNNKLQPNEMLIKLQALKTIQKLRTPAWRKAISYVSK